MLEHLGAAHSSSTQVQVFQEGGLTAQALLGQRYRTAAVKEGGGTGGRRYRWAAIREGSGRRSMWCGVMQRGMVWVTTCGMYGSCTHVACMGHELHVAWVMYSCGMGHVLMWHGSCTHVAWVMYSSCTHVAWDSCIW